MANLVVVNETHKAEVLLHNLVVFWKVIWSAVLTGRWVRADENVVHVSIVSANARSLETKRSAEEIDLSHIKYITEASPNTYHTDFVSHRVNK